MTQTISEAYYDAIQEDRSQAVDRRWLERLRYAQANDPREWFALKEVLRSHRLTRDVMEALKGLRVVRPGQAHAEPQGLVRDVLPDAPVVPEAVIPRGWSLQDTRGAGTDPAVTRISPDQDGADIGVTRSPILIAKCWQDIDDGEIHLDLAWSHNRQWYHRVISRGLLASGADFGRELARVGAKVNANNAKSTIAWLSDYESANQEITPSARMSDHFGWQADGKMGFSVGEDHYGDCPPVRYLGADTGDADLLAATSKKGEASEWVSAIDSIHEWPMALFGVYAAVAPCLLLPLAAEPFCVDWCGRTTGGKSTTTMIAASVWGQPMERLANSLVATWDATPVGIERRCASLCDLPVILDDTQKAGRRGGPDAIISAIYHVTGGQGRQRGSVRGTQKKATWRTVCLTNGEQRAVDFGQASGAGARVLSLWGQPFGPKSATTEAQIDSMSCKLAENYGHAGRAVAQWLVERQDVWPDLRARWRRLKAECRARIEECAADADVAAVSIRVASHLATCWLAAEVLHTAMDLPWSYDGLVPGLVPGLVSDNLSASQDVRAMRHVISLAHSRAEVFDGSSGGGRVPQGGWWGYWEIGDDDSWERICWHMPVIEKALRDAGHEPGAILRMWDERGWLIGGPRGRTVPAMGRTRMIVIPHEAATACGAEEKK